VISIHHEPRAGVWKLPDLWTHRTRPQGPWKSAQNALSHSFHNALSFLLQNGTRALTPPSTAWKSTTRWASDLGATKGRDVTPDRPWHHSRHCRWQSVANRDESRSALFRAFPIGSWVDCSWHRRAQTIARSQTRSRDVSDPVTDRGVRVGGPEMGSLTSRLLSVVLLGGRQKPPPLLHQSARPLSANSHSVFRCAHGPRYATPHDRFDLRSGTPWGGGDGRPGVITPSITPQW